MESRTSRYYLHSNPTVHYWFRVVMGGNPSVWETTPGAIVCVWISHIMRWLELSEWTREPPIRAHSTNKLTSLIDRSRLYRFEN